MSNQNGFHGYSTDPDKLNPNDQAKPSAEQILNDKCVVCDAYANGSHFGVNACAACCAFFRRSIAEQRAYFCEKKSDCSISFEQLKRKLCRYCRFKKCLEKGMLPGKVQKRIGPKDNSLSLPHIIYTDEIECSVKESAFKYTFLQQQRMNRYLSAGSVLQSARFIDEPATMKNYLTIMECEPEFVSKYLSSYGVFKGLTDCDKMAIFKQYIVASRLVEQARIEAHLNTPGSNRLRLLDGSFVETTETACIRFFGSGKSDAEPPVLMDPAFLTRVSMPSALFHLYELVPAIQRLDLSQQEFATLLNLLLWDTANPELSLRGQQIVRRKRQRVIKEFYEYCKSTGTDIPVRFANLILLLTPIQENVQMWKENLLIIAMMKANKSADQEAQSKITLDQL